MYTPAIETTSFCSVRINYNSKITGKWFIKHKPTCEIQSDADEIHTMWGYNSLSVVSRGTL